MSRIPTETDMVVIGSGVSGLVAALTAAEAGARAKAEFLAKMKKVQADYQKGTK